MCDIVTDEISGYVSEINRVISQMIYYYDNDKSKLLNYYNDNLSIINSTSYFINLSDLEDRGLKKKFNSIIESINSEPDNVSNFV